MDDDEEEEEREEPWLGPQGGPWWRPQQGAQEGPREMARGPEEPGGLGSLAQQGPRTPAGLQPPQLGIGWEPQLSHSGGKQVSTA